MWVVFPPIFVADTKINYYYNFVASLTIEIEISRNWRYRECKIQRTFTPWVAFNGNTNDFKEILLPCIIIVLT